MKKFILFLIPVFVALSAVMLVNAEGFQAKNSYKRGAYHLVTKDTSSWEVLPKSEYPFGNGPYEINDEGIFSMMLVAQKLTPGTWYYVEVADTCGWTELSSNDDPQFYGQATDTGKLMVEFSVDVSGVGEDCLEVLVKDAEWVPLEEGGWYYAGGSWDYVLWGLDKI